MRRIASTRAGRRIVAQLLFEPRDVWIGVYWTRDPHPAGPIVRVYLCVIPCLPIRVSWWTTKAWESM